MCTSATASAAPCAFRAGRQPRHHGDEPLLAVYQFDPATPQRCNGNAAGFSSLARYFTAANHIDVLSRTGALRVWRDEMKGLLQSVCHATTEHSIVVRPREMVLELAVATSNGLWDAPFRTWAAFDFEELFSVLPTPLADATSPPSPGPVSP